MIDKIGLNIKKININLIWPYLIIIIIAFVYALPQLNVRGIYVDADTAFHFNRSFEAMSRLKYLNYHNSQISLYGFNASGRVVNALYGPGLGYFFGLILLITQSWFKFQLVTNFILTFVTMALSYWLFNKYSRQSFLSLVFAIVLSLTSYWSISYWYQTSGGMPWGMMFFPLVIDAGIQMYINKDHPVNALRLGLIMTFILESHMLSFVFSVGILAVFFTASMIIGQNRFLLLKQIFFATTISIGLTVGYWADYILIMRSQSILTPFVNLSPGSLVSNLYQGLLFWLLILSIVLIVALSSKLLSWQWLIFIMGTGCLIVASGPKILIDHWNSIGFLRTVQFPVRFTSPGIYLLTFFVVTMLSRLFDQVSFKRSHRIAIGVGIILIASVTTKNLFLNYTASNQRFWKDRNHIVSKFSISNDNQKINIQKIIQSRNRGFEKSITVINCTVPDYLPGTGPVYGYDEHYKIVTQSIIAPASKFNKYINKKGNLVVTWRQNSTHARIVPVVIYHQSVITFNGRKIIPNSTKNGILKVMGHSGNNTVEVSIKVPIVVHIAKLGPIIVLLVMIKIVAFSSGRDKSRH
ncbi:MULTISPECIES: cytochrome B [Leuconostoc]|uniref:cytochrome B n=1 Tax=Leuconostoc TaxID=1243 RepID=UPI0007DE5979|nr:MULTISPECIES: cytochrome B [Leuconostoc]MBZ5998630.1 cytochrome B [Leuconostoc gasicomitatum]CUW12129.1 hypothetical protein C120C_0250 [Leuconostoc inhae]